MSPSLHYRGHLKIYIKMNIGDLVRIGKRSEDVGIVLWRHPTKGLVKVYWSGEGIGWESCARLEILATAPETLDPTRAPEKKMLLRRKK